MFLSLPTLQLEAEQSQTAAAAAGDGAKESLSGSSSLQNDENLSEIDRPFLIQ